MGYHGHFLQNHYLADETHPSEKTHSMVRCGHSQEKTWYKMVSREMG